MHQEINLKKIELNIKKEPYEEEMYYSKDELSSMFKDIDLKNIEDLKIHKLNNNASLSQLMRFTIDDY